MHQFIIDYTDGLLINNIGVDHTLIGDPHYMVKTYFMHRKVKRKLYTYPDQLGIAATIEEMSSENDKTILSVNNNNLGCWIMPMVSKFFIPYFIEIYYNSELVQTDILDCKFKLVNFTLQPKNDKELYVWMNVIENFKKEVQCNISIKNDTVFSSSEFDNIVDIKFPLNDKNKQYYLGLNVGEFYQKNSKNPDFNYHPDGLHNKNSLNIINDILYHHTYIV